MIGGNEHPEQQQEFPLRNQVGLAGFPNQLGDLCHGAVNRQVLQAAIDDHSKQQSKDAKEDADHQQLVAIHAQKLHLGKIGELKVGFARGGLIATCGKRRRGRHDQEGCARREHLGQSSRVAPKRRKATLRMTF